eukprot:1111814-Rhodomonas_salina.1
MNSCYGRTLLGSSVGATVMVTVPHETASQRYLQWLRARAFQPGDKPRAIGISRNSYPSTRYNVVVGSDEHVTPNRFVGTSNLAK